MGSRVLAEPAFTGREQELQELILHLKSAIAGKGSTIFVSGEAGSGKTRLTNEFLQFARKTNVAILHGWCVSNVARPYFPFIEAFRSFFSAKKGGEGAVDSRLLAEEQTDEERELRTWLIDTDQAENVKKYAFLTPQAWKDLLFDVVVKSLLSISAKRPAVLFLDDIHWADSASLSLIHYISRAITSERILLLATFRSEELTVDSEGRPHFLTEVLHLMGREDLFAEIKLANLSQTQVKEVAENILGGDLGLEVAAKLARESRGNALFIVELLRMLVENKGIIKEQNTWRLAVDRITIPSKIRDIILQRLSSLRFNQRRVLDAASVVGEKFDLELLGAVLGQDYLDVLETVNVIAQSTSLVRVEGSFYSFDHALSRDAVYEEIALPLKRGYHLKVAETLLALKKENLPFSDLAYHYAQGGSKENAAKYSLLAGNEALSKWSNAEAIKYFTVVLETPLDYTKYHQEKTAAMEGLGDSYHANGMFELAAKTFEELANSATGNAKMRAYRKEMEAVFCKNEPARLMQLVNNVEKYIADDRLEGARLQINKGRALVYQGNVTEGLKEWEKALKIFEEEYALADAALALIGIGFRKTQYFEAHKEGLKEGLRSVALFQEADDIQHRLDSISVVAYSFRMAGLYEEAITRFLEVFEAAKKIGDFRIMAVCSLGLAYFMELEQKYRESIAIDSKAIEYFKKTDVPVWPQLSASLVRQYAILGDLKNASKYYDELCRIPEDFIIRDRSNILWRILSKAVFLAANNQYIEAKQHFEAFFGQAKNVCTRHAAKLYYAWMLDRQGKSEEAKAVRAEVDTILRKVVQKFAHSDIQARLMVRRNVKVGDNFEMRLDIINLSRGPGELVKFGGAIPSEFKVSSFPSFCSLREGNIEFGKKSVGPFQVETVKLMLEATKPGVYILKPEVTYVNDLGKAKAFKVNPVTVTAQTPQPSREIAPGRISTGYVELDKLLIGGIPENYAIVLAASSSDERYLLVQRYLEAGAAAGEIVFSLTAETATSEALAEKFPSSYFLLNCNIQAGTIIQTLPNVFKIKGVENLTEIDIALAKAFRMIDSSRKVRKIHVGIVSDVLLQHHAITTRRWLSTLLSSLKSKGFTIFAVVDPQMHPHEELQAILSVFDGEIRVGQEETLQGTKQKLKIRRLYNQQYLENEITLTKEGLRPKQV